MLAKAGIQGRMALAVALDPACAGATITRIHTFANLCNQVLV
jgi:hypothetical protein